MRAETLKFQNLAIETLATAKEAESRTTGGGFAPSNRARETAETNSASANLASCSSLAAAAAAGYSSATAAEAAAAAAAAAAATPPPATTASSSSAAATTTSTTICIAPDFE